MPDRRSRLSSARPRSGVRPVTMMRCGSQRNRLARMALSCSSAKSRSSYIQSCTSVRPSAWVASTGHQTHHVARKRRPDARREPRDGRWRGRLNDQSRVVERTRHGHLSQDVGNGLDVGGPRPAHLNAAASHSGHHRPTAGLDVVSVQCVLGTVQPTAAIDPNGRCAFTLDSDAELLQEPAQLGHVRLAGSVANLARPGAAAAASRVVSVPVTDASSR